MARSHHSPPLMDPLVERIPEAANRADDHRAPPGPPQRPRRSGAGSHVKRETHRWARLIHVYTSMIALLVVLFFAATGLTLNHPEWTFGSEVRTTTSSGTFPFDLQLVAADGTPAGIDYLSAAEYVRDELGVAGSVDSFGVTNGEGSIAFVDPGYRADLSFRVDDATYELTVEEDGWVAVVNDLHRGRNAGDAWSWVIDAGAVFLILISVTGLVMQLFLRKRRRSALVAAGAGAVLTVVMVALTLT